MKKEKSILKEKLNEKSNTPLQTRYIKTLVKVIALLAVVEVVFILLFDLDKIHLNVLISAFYTMFFGFIGYLYLEPLERKGNIEQIIGAISNIVLYIASVMYVWFEGDVALFNGFVTLGVSTQITMLISSLIREKIIDDKTDKIASYFTSGSIILYGIIASITGFYPDFLTIPFVKRLLLALAMVTSMSFIVSVIIRTIYYKEERKIRNEQFLKEKEEKLKAWKEVIEEERQKAEEVGEAFEEPNMPKDLQRLQNTNYKNIVVDNKGNHVVVGGNDTARNVIIGILIFFVGWFLITFVNFISLPEILPI